ncbi:TPA: hypothetical protein EYO12_00425 [Candidatus Saccharibacteria bacterium]|nr:hypothetical protein [Candidatus Saccharibacteria bacterium]HIO87560.1 hypothetical protein [Candidatus Saccharibacteria bacterium]
MKLLLTSAGIANQSIADSLSELTDKKPEQTKIGFIPTAMNVEGANKNERWYLGLIDNLRRFGFGWIDLIDISAADVDWRTRLNEVDVVFVGGGNTFHLLNQARKTGFDQWVKKNIKNKVYVGVSAGSILATPTIEVARIEPADPNLCGLTNLTGLGLIDFEIEPHCDQKRFRVVEKWAEQNKKKIYALDDECALKVINRSIEVVSEGAWEFYG